jgi:proteasome lid subunit RPN8/RPN11
MTQIPPETPIANQAVKPQPVPPDIDRAVVEDWPQRAFPMRDGRDRPAARVVIRQSVLNDIYQHGRQDPGLEVCGVLVGRGWQDSHGPFVYVEAGLRGQHTERQIGAVTFTAETWNEIQNEMDQRYPDLRIVGWYHTHPGFGVFLSGMDLFIHENFFNAAEQLAFVYDPHSGEEGLFVWRDGRAARDGYLVEADVPPETPVAGPRPEPTLTAGAGPGASDFAARITRVERRQRWGVVALLGVALLAAVAPFAAWRYAIGPAFWESLRRSILVLPVPDRPAPVSTRPAKPTAERTPEAKPPRSAEAASQSKGGEG